MSDRQHGGDHARRARQRQRDEAAPGRRPARPGGGPAGWRARVSSGVAEPRLRRRPARSRPGCGPPAASNSSGNVAGRHVAGRARPRRASTRRPLARRSSIGSGRPGCAGVGGDPGQQDLQVLGQPRRPSPRRTGRCCRSAHAGQLAVALARSPCSGRRRRCSTRQAGRGSTVRPGSAGRAARGVLQDDHGLEQRGAAGVAVGLQLVDDRLERARPGGRRRPARCRRTPARKSGEGAAAVDGGAQHEGVDEEPDDVVPARRRSRPAIDGADGDVVLAGLAGEQDLAGGDQRHEQGGVVARGRGLAAAAVTSAGTVNCAGGAAARCGTAGRGRSVGRSSGAQPASCARQ